MAHGKFFTSKLKKLIPFLIILLLLEVSTRVAHTIVNDVKDSRKESNWFDYSPEVGWKRRSGFNGDIQGIHRAFDSKGFLLCDSAQIKQKTTPKILILGDSCTYGTKVPTEKSLAELLDKLLPEYAVINLSMSGYSSYQCLKTFEKYADKLDPEIVIMASNMNDRRYVLREFEQDSSQWFRKVYLTRTVMRKLGYASYIMNLMSLVIAPEKGKTPEEIYGRSSELPVNELNARVPPEKYRENLANMAQLAKKKNISLVFLLLPDNPISTARLYKGIELITQAQYNAAIAELTSFIREPYNMYGALSKLYLADAYKKKGLVNYAEHSLKLGQGPISLHGGMPLYFDSQYHEIMSSVAKDSGVFLCDARAPLKYNPEHFIDFCHFDENGHLLVANLLAKKVNGISKTKKD